MKHVGELKKDSKFRDLGLVMALFVGFSRELNDIGIDTTLDDNANTHWVQTIVAYALNAEINLAEIGVPSVAEIIEEMDVQPFGLKKANWKASTSFTTYWRRHHIERPIMGGKHFNILKWTRAQRAKCAFDGVDPLKDFSDAAIKSGNLVPE